MGVAFGAVGPSSAGTSTPSATTLSWTHTAVTGDTEIMIDVGVGPSSSDSGCTVAVKVDGATTNVTQVGSNVHSNAMTSGFGAMFRYAPSGGVTVGAHTILVTRTGGTGTVTMEGGSTSYKGGGGGIGTPVSATGSSAAPTCSVTAPTTSMIHQFQVGGQPYTANARTLRTRTNVGTSSAAGNMQSQDAAGTGSALTMGGTMGASDWWATLAVEVKQGATALSGTLATSGAGTTAFVGTGPPQLSTSGSGSTGFGGAPAVGGGLGTSGSGTAVFAVGKPFVSSVDSTGRFFQDQYGVPILPIIDHQWHLIAWGGDRSELSPGTTTPLGVFQAYSAHQAGNGINAALVMAICSDQGGPVGPFTDGRTWDGIAPFTGGAIGVLNNTYWSRVDDMLNSMAAQGITCWLNIIASYTIASGTALAGITTTNAATYGAALAARYKNFPNIVWHLGADYFANKEAEFAAIITALRAGGDTHLVACEYMAESNSSVDSSNTATGTFGRSSAMSFRDIYSYNTPNVEVDRAYALSANPSVLPSLYFNGYYDQQPSAWDTVLLDGKLWALTSGSPGFFYGSEATWQWGVGVFADILTDQFPNTWLPAFRTWYTALTNWQNLIPDPGSAFITSARGTKATALAPGGGATAYSGGNTYLTGGVSADGKLAVLYTPTSRTITIDGTKMVSAYSAKWVDPYTFAVTSATSSVTSYATPGNNSQGNTRWLLVLQALASGSLATSGSGTASFAGKPALSTALGTSGSGTTVFAASALSMGGALATSGSGTSTFAASAPKIGGTLGTNGSGTATFAASAPGVGGVLGTSGSGTAVFAGTPALSTPLATSGSGTVTFSTSPGFGVPLATSGSGTTTFSASGASSGSIATGGSGTTTFAGAAMSTSGTLATSGSGTTDFVVEPGLSAALATSGSGTTTFAVEPGFVAPFPTSGSGTTAFGPLVGLPGTLTTSGSGTTTFAGSAMSAGGTLATGGSGTALFSGGNNGSGNLITSGSGTTGFAVKPGAVSQLATSGSGTADFAPTAALSTTLVTSGSGTTTFAGAGMSITGALLTSGSGTTTYAGSAGRIGTLQTSGAGTAVFVGHGTETGAFHNVETSYAGPATRPRIDTGPVGSAVTFVGPVGSAKTMTGPVS